MVDRDTACTKDQERREKLQELERRILRMRGIMGTVVFFLGNQQHKMTPEFEDVQLWAQEMRDQLDEMIDLIPVIPSSEDC